LTGVLEVLVAELLEGLVVVFDTPVPASPAEEGTPLPRVLSLVTPLLVPPIPVAVVAPGDVEPEVVEASVAVSVVLQAASDRARMPPSRALWNGFMCFLLIVDGSAHHARSALRPK